MRKKLEYPPGKNISPPKFPEPPKNIETRNLNPQKLGQAYVYTKILESPPPTPKPPGGWRYQYYFL